MRLQNYYYKVNKAGRIEVLRDCDVYKGHFPGKAVCPGVFNVQMIKERVSAEVGVPLKIVAIKQCRLTALATPDDCPELSLDLSIRHEGDYLVEARLYAVDKTGDREGRPYIADADKPRPYIAGRVYMELRCTMQSL